MEQREQEPSAVLRDLRQRRVLARQEDATAAPAEESKLREVTRRQQGRAASDDVRGAGIAALRERLVAREAPGLPEEMARPQQAFHLESGLVARETSAEFETGLPPAELLPEPAARPRHALVLVAGFLALLAVLALALPGQSPVALPPESQIIARFHDLAITSHDLPQALQLVHAFDAETVRRATPRLQEMLDRLPGGSSRLEFLGPPRLLRPGVLEIPVRETFRVAGDIRQADLAVVLRESPKGWRIHAHLSSPLLSLDLDALPRPAGTYFSTPFQAVLNTCHLATEEEDWWRLVPRLARLG